MKQISCIDHYFGQRLRKALIPWTMTGVLGIFSYAVNAVDLSGEWLGEGYKCGFQVSTETVQIEQKDNSVEATKITGDQCVPAGSRTFVGTIDGNTIKATWTTGFANKPACCQTKSNLTIVDNNTLTTNVGITFKRVSSQSKLDEGLVAYYPFDGNTQDASGNHHHGTAAGGVSYAEGKMGQAAQFDGKSGVVTATLPKVKKTYTVSMFAKLNSNNRVENQFLYLTRKNAKDRLGYLSTYPVGQKKWHYGSRRYGKGWEDRGTAILDPEGMQVNKWYHLAFVLNDKDISLYVNGKLLKTIKSAHNSDIEAHGNLLFLVGGTTEKYQWMDGLIDEVRFYNRALSADEIKILSQGEVTTKPAPTTKPKPTEPKPTFACEPKKNCGAMESCEEAYYHLEQCGNKRLDRDQDGIPCESLCVEK